jgi:glycosyltransferase involved in cell wall biosynthesis
MAQTSPSITIRVLVLSYNQQDVIRQALRSVNHQVCKYPIFVTIHDDCSTDNTQEVIKSEMDSSPHRWELITPPFNQYDAEINFVHNLILSFEETFIARLDGDDYWTDPSKLQIQADKLLDDKSAALCCHKFQVLEDGEKTVEWPPPRWRGDLEGHNLAQENFLGSLTVMFRNSTYKNNIPINYEKPKLWDYFTWSLLSQNNKISYIDYNMATYRIRSQSVFSSLNAAEKLEKILSTKILISNYIQPNYIHLWKKSIEADRTNLRKMQP